MKNSCSGCTWLTYDCDGPWCNDLDCRPDFMDPNCKYKE